VGALFSILHTYTSRQNVRECKISTCALKWPISSGTRDPSQMPRSDPQTAHQPVLAIHTPGQAWVWMPKQGLPALSTERHQYDLPKLPPRLLTDQALLYTHLGRRGCGCQSRAYQLCQQSALNMICQNCPPDCSPTKPCYTHLVRHGCGCQSRANQLCQQSALPYALQRHSKRFKHHTPGQHAF
jgi:hypothetical protein